MRIITERIDVERIVSKGISMKHINIFEAKTDDELAVLYRQFLVAEKEAGFRPDSELGKIKEEYIKYFGYNATFMIQIELTHVIADRWYAEHEDKNRFERENV